MSPPRLSPLSTANLPGLSPPGLRFDFLAPAFIGNVVTINCEMNFVGRTSMEVGVEVLAEDLRTGEVRHIASSYVIYVALDENRKPSPVPPLVPADAEEQAIIERARIRRKHRGHP